MSRKLSYVFFGLSALVFASVFGNMFNPNANRPSEFELLFSYSVGQLVIPYFLMIIGIYFFKKSQHNTSKKVKRNSNWVILGVNIVLLLVYCFCVFNTQMASGDVDVLADASLNNSASTDFVCSEFCFTVPEGWTQVTPDRKQIAAMLVKFNSANEMTAMIMVETGIPTEWDLSVAAEELAGCWGGGVLDLNGQLAGVKAAFIKSEYKGGQMIPVEGVIVIREGQIYLIMGGVSTNANIDTAINDIVTSWKWL